MNEDRPVEEWAGDRFYSVVHFIRRGSRGKRYPKDGPSLMTAEDALATMVGLICRYPDSRAYAVTVSPTRTFSLEEMQQLVEIRLSCSDGMREQITPENLASEFNRLLKAEKCTGNDDVAQETCDAHAYTPPKKLMEMAFFNLAGRHPNELGSLRKQDIVLCNAAWRLYIGNGSIVMT